MSRVETDVRRMIDEARRAMGGLDGMVLNVGTFGGIGLDGVSAEEWNRIYDVNVRGPMLACREALPKFEDGGSIVFISSIAALGPARRWRSMIPRRPRSAG